MTATPPTSDPSTVPVRHALAELLRDAIRLDRTQSDPIVAGRNAIGVALPLAIGAIHGNAALGLASAVGALQTALADRPGPYRLRMLRMTLTALAAGVTAALAVCFSRSDAASALLLLVLAFAAGLLLTAGPSGAQVGIAATAVALIIGHTPQSPSMAVHAGLLVFAGGGVQTVLAIAAWPLRRHRPERLALAGLYQELAGMARSTPGTHVGPPLVESLAGVRRILYGLGHDHGPSVEAYRVLLDEGERIRRELLLLAAQAERLDRDDDAAAAVSVRAVLSAAGHVLDQVAGALHDGRNLERRTFEGMRAVVREALQLLDDAEAVTLTRRAAAVRVRALAGQLRAVVDTSRVGASEGRAGEGRSRDDRQSLAGLLDSIAILRANLSRDSAVLRHAVRLAVLVSASDLIAREVGVGRGYWIPLTVLVVLRPDFSSTFQRALMRGLGTIVGLVLATVLVHWVPGGEWYRIALIAILYFAMRFAGPGNIALSATALSALVVVLLSLAGVAPLQTLDDRSADTLIGGALALLATLAWPVWERRLLRARLAELFAAYRDHLVAVVDLDTSPATMQRVRTAARLARTNAQASVDRARAEPISARGEVELGETVLAHTHRLIHAAMSLDSIRPVLRAAPPIPELNELAWTGADVLDHCAQAIRTTRAPRVVAKLRPVQIALAEALTTSPRPLDDGTTAVVIDATDRIANSLDTLVSELRRQAEAPTNVGVRD